MYTSYYSLTVQPFEHQADPRFFFDAAQQRSALSALEKGLLAGAGFTILTGGEGMGKTTILDFALSKLDSEQFTVARLDAAPIAPDDIIREIASVFGLDAQELGGDETRERLTAFLTDCLRAGKRPVLFVDQCERLLIASLRELLSLAEIRADDKEVLHLVLIGRSQLRQTLAGSDLALHGRHRVGGHHLQPLEGDDTRRLIEYRLRQAGWQGDPEFSSGAFEMIFLKTGGVPGRIISFCDELLSFACAHKRRSISNGTIRKLSAELQKARLKGERGDAAAGQAADSVWPQPPENAPGLESDAIAVTSDKTPPSPWRRALVYGEYAAGIAITALIVWQVSAGLFGPGRVSTAPAESVAISLPIEPAVSASTSEAPAEADEDALAARSVAGNDAPSQATEPESPAPYVIDFGDKSDDEETAPGSNVRAATANTLDSDGATLAAAPPAPPAPAAPTQDGGAADHVDELYADLTAEPAVGQPEKPKGAALATPVTELGDKLAALEQLPASRITPLLNDATTEVAESASAPATDELPQSLLTAALSKPLPLLVEKPALEPAQTVMEPEKADGKLAAIDALDEPSVEPRAGATADTVTQSSPEEEPPAPASENADLERLAERSGIAHEGAPMLAVNPVQEEPAPSDSGTALSPGLSVTGMTLTHGIVDKEPVDDVDRFAASDGEVFAFARFKNSGAPARVTFAWYRDDRLAATAKLKVGRSTAWRTWSRSRVQRGDWRVVITNESGGVLAENTFIVE